MLIFGEKMPTRTFKNVIAAFLAAVLAFSNLFIPAHAEESSDKDAPECAEYTLDGKTWDELIEEFYSTRHLENGYASFGYYNTVTGETHFYDEDRWLVGASIYKLPLAMLYAEKINAGELSLEDIVWDAKLETLLYRMVVNSNNEDADTLCKHFGGFKEMRRGFLKYFGTDEESVEDIYWHNNNFTARHMLNCLKYLYEHSEDYEYIINLMLIASPDRNFKSKEQSFEIAHKYGYVPGDYGDHYNDTAICYTDDPICIVMLTQGVPRPSTVLADFCTLACDYAQSSREQRLEIEEKERLEEARAEEERRIAEEKAEEEKRQEEAQRQEEERKAEETLIPAEKNDETGKSRMKVIVSLCALIPVLSVAVALNKRKKK